MNEQSIIIPALSALAIYLLITFAIVPLWRRHRARYSQYLPLHSAIPNLDLDNFSNSTSSLRHRFKGAIMSFLFPWTRNFGRVVDGSSSPFDTTDEDLEDELGGENLTALSQIMAARREASEARRSEAERRQRVNSSDRRLSRDLEQGFMDSSDEEDEGEVEGRGITAGQERWRNNER